MKFALKRKRFAQNGRNKKFLCKKPVTDVIIKQQYRVKSSEMLEIFKNE